MHILNYYVHIRISKYIYTVYIHIVHVFQIMNIFFWPKFAKSRRWRGDLKFILSYRWHGASLIMTMNAQEILFSTCWFIAKKLSLCTRMLLSAAHRLLPYNPVSVQLTRSFFQAHNFWTALLLGKTEKAVLGLEDRSLWKSSSLTFAAC